MTQPIPPQSIYPSSPAASAYPLRQTQLAAAVIPFPWLWFWLAAYLIQLPALVVTFYIPFLIYILFGDSGSAARPFFSELSTRGSNFVELIPYMVVLLGVIFMFFPKLRAARLESKYGLKDLSQDQLADIRAFLECYAPNLKIKVNLLGKDQYAFVYPTGYRSFAIAVFGPLVMLWRQDQEAARAVLLHEVAHYRSGDGHIQGTGSLFAGYLRSWLLIYGISMVLPFFLNLLKVIAETLIGAFQSGGSSSILRVVLTLIGSILTVFIPNLLLVSISVFLATLSIIFMPLMGIWIAEINADFYAAQILGNADAVRRALNYVGKRPSFFIWLLRRMTHPPEFIRRIILGMQNRNMSLILILMLMPLAFLARLFVVLAQNIVNIIGGSETSLAAVLSQMGAGMGNLAIILVFAALLVLAWVWIAPRWQSIFASVREGIVVQRMPYFVASGLTFACVILLAMVGGLLRVVFR